MMNTHRPLHCRVWRDGGSHIAARPLPEEIPVALSCNGTTIAVMMATPADLEDFGRGFTLTEGIATLSEIEDITIVQAGPGLDVQVWLTSAAEARLAARRRTMMGPVGCGLCGIDSIEAALRPTLAVLAGTLRLTPDEITGAMMALPQGQSLHHTTRAAHAAAFLHPQIGLALLREDVGRHNALDKLIGALAIKGASAADGALIVTSRVSIDLVQKAVASGATILIGASAPTAHAVNIAEKAGLTLVGLARQDGFEVFTHPHRIDWRGETDAD